MKKFTITAFIVFSFFMFNSIFAGNNSSKVAEEKYDLIVDNYLAGIESNNFGLKTSSVYYLGELKSSESVIPLLKILRNDDEDIRTRITAALALYKIGDGRGIYRLKTMSKFEDNQRLANLSEKFYYSYLLKEMGYEEELNENSLEEYVQNTALPNMFN
ncbi:MAG: HEAT repeat domain-containing protein [Ignavibacteriae bacterium]|nr:HEAT repeat domain-containing protein [Ignavibacteriota bacterium]